MGHSRHSHHSKRDDSSEDETEDSDTGSSTDGSSSADEKYSHKRDHEALIKSRHSKHNHHAHHPHGGLPSWAMYGAIAGVILGLLAGSWYFLVGLGAEPASSPGTTTKPPIAGGTAGGTGAGGAGGGTAGGGAGSGTKTSATATSKTSASATGTAGGTKTSGGGSGAATGTAKDGTAAPSPSSGGGSPASSSGKVIGAFWETWGPVEIKSIPFEKYTHVFWFVATDVKGKSPPELDFYETPDNSVADFISGAHAAGSKALFSVGGWSNSDTFSKTMASADSRTAYVTMLKGYIDAYGWDGVDADWEYPGAAGNTQDFDLKNDLPNFLLFFEELRKTLGDDVLITVDTSAKTWADPGTGEPSTDLGDFAKHLDFFTIMTYDAWGSSLVSGPNFPISSDCSPPDSPWSYPDAAQKWIDAGIPAEKILLGMAGYGHKWAVADFDETGGAAKAKSPVFQVASKAEGVVNYATVLSSSLDKDAKLDECTASMYKYADGVITIWDNAETTKTKAAVSKKLNLGGCNLFAMLTDTALIDAMIESC